ncbi:MAG: nucleoside triphosphate pyrophosphohydrolase, partial [Candidatus Marinimicrobia bacterium]|nr:nucleoside triphosphate pyrophosphohydrolase [Candidatus Neomarinimicrobiota bacterium]MBT5115829.1 nucleoside triphosphate pyrophosphohydrolase [Candidatus Neomarinimicrobiota bacterium]MBT5224154.1 nucleoside triphosphate pyrophosphohydrolase [Candidatus Neomarinimicrobiota bacterium]MBT5749021.1 nucleoside triphosphate pyrophosphohydrolase [Candidatus Neomarinimicrobiota bacterium]MBT6414391.1 nucleoside triphosphate pyrophosphohydrolase [Candidatus Neomarinimicrobiota bacterium]
IEEELEAKGKKLEESTLEEMDEIWERAKQKS